MGRPGPCVLFAQNFVHSHLDEYVDEGYFASAFALEVFVYCKGETRFSWLCQPFLYSHSSSNVLDVEAVVTSHLVVRGSFRSLSLVIYGNTAEDLGQFNIEFDDSSINHLVSLADGKLEDLRLVLHSSNLTMEQPVSALQALSLPVPPSDISIEAKKLLQLMLKIWELPNLGNELSKIVSILVSVASSCVTHAWERSNNYEQLQSVISEAKKELFEVYKHGAGNASVNLLEDGSFIDSETDLAASKQLVDMLRNYFCFRRESTYVGNHQISQSTYLILGLSVALLLCSGRESCFHFVNGEGMEQLAHVFGHNRQNSTSITLLLLGVVEQAIGYSFGCERFLGWWPREDENIPTGNSEGCNGLVNLLLQQPRHAVASLATKVLHRLRSAVLSILEGFSSGDRATTATLDMLISAKSQLTKLLKLMRSCSPIEDPSLVACATRLLNPGQTEDIWTYAERLNIVFFMTYLHDPFEERGFLPLSVALLSASTSISEVEHAMDVFVDIASSIKAIIISLLFCRSVFIFLLQQPDLCATLIDALKGADDVNKDTCLPLRYVSVLTAKGFLCSSKEVGLIIRMHLRVVNAIDRLLTSAPHSEEFLWVVLWELCDFARSDCGRLALLALGYFPEVHPEYLSAFINNSTSLGSSLPMADSKFLRTSISPSSGSARPPPPLPPTPPPYSSSLYNVTSNKTLASQSLAHSQMGSGTVELPQSSPAPSSSGARANTYAPPPQLQHPAFSLVQSP